jgi:hypothetical protein
MTAGVTLEGFFKDLTDRSAKPDLLLHLEQLGCELLVMVAI